MGKATIVSGGSSGLYQIAINYDNVRLDAEITRLNGQISALQSTGIPNAGADVSAATAALNSSLASLDVAIGQFNAKTITEAQLAILVQDAQTKRTLLEEADKALAFARAELASKQSQKSLLEKSRGNDRQVAAWCADYSESLSGTVGTIEPNGQTILPAIIVPGFADNAIHVAATDGQLQKPMSSGPSGVYFNQAILPGWQKWKPTYRLGTIYAMTGATCTVDLDTATSSQQSLPVNQAQTLTNVPIEYMTCNEAAFTSGDRVIVQFVGQDWANPKVIGFESNPRSCNGWFEDFSGAMWTLGAFDDQTTWPAGCIGVGSQRPVSSTIPNPSTMLTEYMNRGNFSTDDPPYVTPQDPCCYITNKGHKLYLHKAAQSIGSGLNAVGIHAGASPWGYNSGIWTLIPGDAVNMKKPDGSGTGDSTISTAWKRMEVDYEIYGGEWYDESTGNHIPTHYHLIIILVTDFANHFASGGSFQNVTLPIGELTYIRQAEVTANPKDRWDGVPIERIWNLTIVAPVGGQSYGYAAGSANTGLYYEWTAPYAGRLVIDRTTQSYLQWPDSIKAIMGYVTQAQGYKIKGVRFLY